MRLFRLLILLAYLPLTADIHDGLVAKFTFDKGDARDELEKHHPKAVGVSYPVDRFGNAHASSYVHGNPGSYLNLGTEGDLKNPSASISLWVKIDIIILGGKGYSVNPIILTKNDTTSDFFEAYTIAYDYSNDKIVAATTLSELHQLTLHTTEPFKLNEWHHLVLTYDDNFTCMYIDGELEIKMAKNFRTRFLETDSVMVGNSANKKNQRFLCASVDDIYFYNRVISPTEVLDLYNLPNPNRVSLFLSWFFKIMAALGVMILIMWLVINRYRNDLKREKEKNRINALLNELETRAIRTQMNPHFIFNSLGTLQRFILEEDTANSNLYLTKFSKLLRKLIETSTADSISLCEEIIILNSYIDIERMRFDNSFNHEISTDMAEPCEVYIPFMLVQPFVENAIWHGLLPKKGDRFLKVNFRELDNKRILCTIDDNGVGRHDQPENPHPLKKRSVALEFIKQRLDLLGKSTGIDCSFTIKDKRDAEGNSLGTTVEIIIPKLIQNDTRSSN